jgi:8-oxo-dGTP diphosphatase
MRPAWFKLSEIPYELMWDDSHYWLPHVLEGKKVNAEFTYDEDNKKVKEHHLQLL